MLLFWVLMGVTVALLAVGNGSLLLSALYTGMVSEGQIKGWPTNLFDWVLRSKLLLGSHLAGLAVLKQILGSSESPQEESLGFTPVEATQ